MCSNHLGVCSVVGIGQPSLGVDRGRTAHPRGGDGLPVGVVDQVAGGEHAVQRGGGGAVTDQHVALGVEVDGTAHQLGAGVVADRDEHTGHRQSGFLAGDHVVDAQAR